MTPIVEFRDVGFRRSEGTIFHRLTVSVPRGGMVALLGPNGVGKTTLLNMVVGLVRPQSGTVLVDGRALPSWERKQLSCYAALVPQDLELPFAFRVEEVVAQGRVPHLRRFGGPSVHDHAVIEDAMEAVGVLHLRDRLFSELSGGERQRVKLAVGLAQQPRLILLDEPMQQLDVGRQIELISLLQQLNQQGITIVAAMHDLALIGENFSTAILLTPEPGSMMGRTEEILQPDLLARAFSVPRSQLENHRLIGPLTDRVIG
jgi:iron complex transport system ATP-binding protein